MSKEYIDRSATVDALNKLCGRVCQYSKAQRKVMCGACPLGDAFTVIEDDLPAADVVEVRRGRWINIVHAIVDTTGYCDKCHSQSVWRTRDMAYEICPRCGARMDIEEDT